MKKILCYGDSNTYGFIPETCGRYEKEERWTGIISKELAPEYEILEQGLNNRTGFFKSPESIKHSGGEYLSIYLQNHKDIDICILALGTNDAQFFYNLNEEITKNGLLHLINSVREVNNDTKIILIPPVKIKENILDGIFSMQFDRNSIKTIETIFPLYEKIAKQNNCYYLDFNEFVAPSEKDGLHFSKDSHKIIAQHVVKFIKSID
jgi:lysophospholipase L1-like esterase